jgi:hypothetical protein
MTSLESPEIMKRRGGGFLIDQSSIKEVIWLCERVPYSERAYSSDITIQ